MKKYLLLFQLVLFGACALSQPSADIRLNQIGFYTYGQKMAAIINSGTASTFAVKSLDRTTIYFSGDLGVANTWAQSGESVKIADFSAFKTPGNYVLEIPSFGYSHPFLIQDNVLSPLSKALVKAFYFNRSSTALPPQYAGKWARAEGHPDTSIIILPSAASTLRPAGSTISSPKGWYDAGDYNSYIVNSGITTYTLLASYEHYKSYYDTLGLNIPESQNNVPDILDEIKWNLDWMLTMQDPNDGGVYTKKTTANFSGFIMPEEDIAARFVVKKSTAATLDFAAVMAVAYRIYKDFDLEYANTCLDAAKKAYDWGLANPSITFSNPPAQNGYPAVLTGGYGDPTLTDEMEWASNELYIATKNDSYYARGFKQANTYSVPDWGNIRMLGLYSLLYHRKELTPVALADTSNMKSKVTTLADAFLTYQKSTSPYKVLMGRGGNGDFVWGSNAVAANQAMLLLNAYLLTRNIDYAHASVAQVDYLLGRNATGYCFVTGEGSKRVMHIHQRQSEADMVDDPVPGWLSGGPTNDTGDGCPNNATYRAKSFVDSVTCYTKNEIAINWNAPAVYITGALEFYGLFDQDGPIATSIDNGEWLSAGSSMRVFPVPAYGQINASIMATSSSYASVYLADITGKKYPRASVQLIAGENELHLDTKDLVDGIYFLSVETDNQKFKSKVVIDNK